MHWYKSDGTACHTVIGKNGKERDCTLRDARKMNLSPSVTGILDIVAHPALISYLIKQHLEAAWDTTQSDYTSVQYSDWSKDVKIAANAHSKEARDKGAGIHAQLERYYQGKVPTMYAGYVEAVSKALQKTYIMDEKDMVPERSFSREGFGGAVDLSSKYLIVDFKFKANGFDDKEKLVYDTHLGQLAAYRYGLDFPDAVCANVFIGGEGENIKVRIEEHSEEDLDWGLRYFMNCLGLWETVKRYSSHD